MGVEQRGNREFYYRKRRINGQVRSTYVGGGAFGARCAAYDACLREEKAEARRREREALAAELAVDAAVDEAGALITALAEGSLLANGFHMHRGEWREKRI